MLAYVCSTSCSKFGLGYEYELVYLEQGLMGAITLPAVEIHSITITVS
jgi:hypothetical protein